jgi:alanyl-tRNA synthetase
MTERLYYTDCYLRDFTAQVTEVTGGGRRIYLDRTAFYPESGGQASDRGWINGVVVEDVQEDGEGRVAHLVAAPLTSAEAACRIDWERRYDLMQQHSGQHLLSAVCANEFGWATVSVHLGDTVSTVDLETAAISPELLVRLERRVNELAWENRPLRIEFADAAGELNLRKASARAGTLRIVTIEGLDRSACGGTHVRATGEIGLVLLRRQEKIRGIVRLEFVCGGRALARARADAEALNQVAQLYSCGLDDVPAQARRQHEALRAAEKHARALAAEVAGYRGREAYHAAAPDEQGIRRWEAIAAEGSLDEARAVAQSFCAGDKAVALAAVRATGAILLAASADVGIDAGQSLKSILEASGGRGGGNACLAQGSVPPAQLEAALARLRERLQTLRQSNNG